MINWEDWEQITATCKAKNAALIAVSKTKPNEAILALHNAGQVAFGENRVQELLQKYDELPKTINWHLIGHLQRNKVKQVVDKVVMIHSVDSGRLLNEIEKESAKLDVSTNVLLQFHIAAEESKYGFTKKTFKDFWQHKQSADFPHVNFCGVMGMATFTDDKKQVELEFQALGDIYQWLRTDYFSSEASFTEISMGMSGDYQIALECGSTMVRVGSKLFV